MLALFSQVVLFFTIVTPGVSNHYNYHHPKPPIKIVATLNYAQIESLWISMGGSSQAASMAAAIALAESTGQTGITNPTDSSIVGLWQINTGPSGSPQYKASDMLNPFLNAKAAIAISKNGTDWNPWQTYTNGAYLKFLKSGVTPAPLGSGLGGGSQTLLGSILQSGPLVNSAYNTVGDAIVPGYSQLNAAYNGLSGFFTWISTPKNIIRVLEVMGGIVLALLALDETVKAAGGKAPTTTVVQAVMPEPKRQPIEHISTRTIRHEYEPKVTTTSRRSDIYHHRVIGVETNE
ncbi:MAG: transglycosylase SLT domain-containing protein [Gammaproteobacteria bacterium]|jgi:hypothetical protein